MAIKVFSSYFFPNNVDFSSYIARKVRVKCLKVWFPLKVNIPEIRRKRAKLLARIPEKQEEHEKRVNVEDIPTPFEKVSAREGGQLITSFSQVPPVILFRPLQVFQIVMSF